MRGQPLFVSRTWYNIGKPTVNPHTTEKRQQNKEILTLAVKIRAEHKQVFRSSILFVTDLL